MLKYSEITRKYLGEYLSSMNEYDGPGIYIIACYPMIGCVYIGKSETVFSRVFAHFEGRQDTLNDVVRNFFPDSMLFRIDILHAPPTEYICKWLDDAETKLIAHFRPFANQRLMPDLENEYKPLMYDGIIK